MLDDSDYIRGSGNQRAGYVRRLEREEAILLNKMRNPSQYLITKYGKKAPPPPTPVGPVPPFLQRNLRRRPPKQKKTPAPVPAPVPEPVYEPTPEPPPPLFAQDEQVDFDVAPRKKSKRKQKSKTPTEAEEERLAREREQEREELLAMKKDVLAMKKEYTRLLSTYHDAREHAQTKWGVHKKALIANGAPRSITKEQALLQHDDEFRQGMQAIRAKWRYLAEYNSPSELERFYRQLNAQLKAM